MDSILLLQIENWNYVFYINTGRKCRNLLTLQIKEKNKFVLIIAICKDVYPLINGILH